MFALFHKDDIGSISVNELDTILNEINLIDIREPNEYSQGHITKARNIPMGQLLTNPGQYLNKNQRYYIICQSGGRSQRATSVLKKAGFDVINVKGGMGSYIGKNRK